MTPLVSVIIPTHNRAHLVGEAVNSVLQQTYSHVEIIVVDDGSTDDTWEKLDEYGMAIHVIKQTNSGVSAARNRAITEAKGEFIAFLDSDDCFMPSKLETQVAFMAARPEVAMSYTDYLECDFALNPIRVYAAEYYTRGWRDLLMGCTIATPTVMVRRSILDEVGLFDETLPLAEDLDLWCRIAKQGSIQPIAAELTKVRIHEGGMQRNPQQIIQYWLNLVQKFYQGHNTPVDWIDRQHTCSNLYSYVAHIALKQGASKKIVLWYTFNTIYHYPFSSTSRYLLKVVLQTYWSR